jgi:putative flippase GtrA
MGVAKYITPQFIRWVAVTVVFTGATLALIKTMVGVLGWPYSVATIITSETCTLVRFITLDRSVFKMGGGTWTRLWQYHVASAAGFAVWWTSANLLQSRGVQYLLAAVLATFFSVGINIITNFFWVWRKPATEKPK